MVEKINLGIIGVSEGNGHPYSFSAIINGFNNGEMRSSGWNVIYHYLKEREESEFGFENVKVTHVWTQDVEESKMLAKASKIPNIVEKIEHMINNVDGVIIARDDEKHFEMARGFLEAGKYVFVDKPLSINLDELRFYKPYLENGKLMSCSGVRYAKELDKIRANVGDFGNIKLIRAAVIKDWEKYGTHVLDGIFGVIDFQVESVYHVPSQHTSVILKNFDKSIIQVDALGETVKTFQFDFWSDKKRFHAEITDNFSMFRKMLFHFIKMIKTKKPVIDPNLVINIMKVLIAANISKKEKRVVQLNEIKI